MPSSLTTTFGRRLRSTAAATLDLVAAAVYLAIVVGIPLVVIDDVTGGLLHARTVHLGGGQLHADPIPLVVAIVAFGGSYPFVADPRLLDRLSGFVWTLLLSLFALAVVASIPLLAVGGVPSDSTVATAGQAGVVAGAYVVAVWSHASGERAA